MAAIISGWFCGYAMAVVSTLALVAIAPRVRTAAWLDRWFARDVPGAVLAVPVFTGMVIAWTMFGIGFGFLYELLGGSDSHRLAGVSNVPFTVFVLGLAALPAPLLTLLWPRYWWFWAANTAVFIALFAFLLPYLASR